MYGMIKVILALVFSTYLSYCSVDRLQELFEVTNRLERTLEHFCRQEIFNRELEIKVKVDVEQLQAESSERSQAVEQNRQTSQQNFYSILRLSEQLEEIKKQTIEADEKSSSEKDKNMEKEVTELKEAFNLLRNENLRVNQEFSRKLELFEAEKIELKKEIEELKIKLKKSGDSEAIESLSTRVSKAEETAVKVVENTRQISSLKSTFRVMTPTLNEFLWKIENYSNHKNKKGRNGSIYSDSFLVGRGNYGYRFRMEAELNSWRSSTNTHVRFFYQIQKSDIDDILPWPFMGRVRIEVLSQENDKGYIAFAEVVSKADANGWPGAYMKPGTISHGFSPNNEPAGYSNSFPMSTVEQPPYLVNDIIYVKITVSDVKSLE